MDRSPSENVKNVLRREVNWGCPFPGCGSPFLMFHHFDPPWREQQHHNPDGMIALCVEHATYADGDSYSKEYLRTLKKHPFIQERINAVWSWQPEQLLFLVGGSFVFSEGPALSLHGTPVLKAKRIAIPDDDRSYVVLSGVLRSGDGKTIMEITDNNVSVPVGDITLLRASTRGKDFKIEYRSGDKLSLRYRRYTLEELEELVQKLFPNLLVKEIVSLAKATSYDSQGLVPSIEITGHLKRRDVDLVLGNKQSDIRILREWVRFEPRVFHKSGKLRVVFDKEDREIFSFG